MHPAQADQAVANFCYCTGVAFNVVETPYFKQMLARVAEHGPGYKPPSRSVISTTFLDKAVKSVEEDLVPHRSRSAKFGVTVTSDGWSNTANRCLCARARSLGSLNP